MAKYISAQNENITFRIQQPSDPQLFLGHCKGLVQVFAVRLHHHTVHINKVWPGRMEWN